MMELCVRLLGAWPSNRNARKRKRHRAGTVFDERRTRGVGVDDLLALSIEIVSLFSGYEIHQLKRAVDRTSLAALQQDRSVKDILFENGLV